MSDGNGKPRMTQATRNIILRWCIALCSFVALAIGASGKDGTDFLQVSGMYFVTWDAKQAIFPQSIITADMRQHINRARWSKGQHKLRERLIGWQCDLNKDGVGEVIVETGQWGAWTTSAAFAGVLRSLLLDRFPESNAEMEVGRW